MVALIFRDTSLNNFLRICFILMLISLSAAAQQGKMTTVVRADAKTGRLVRSVLMEPKTAVANMEIKTMIDRIADEQGVESQLVHSVIRAESNYNPGAVSSKGAQGIMQLIPSTARRFGVANVFDAQENVEGGVKYLRFLLDYFKGDYAKAIAAYNAGENAVEKYRGVPPFAETQNYVSRVARNLAAARKAAPQVVAQAGAKAISDNNRETVHSIQTSTGSDGRIYYRNP
jgi:soluble lytic murein transglycosylase-like protein